MKFLHILGLFFLVFFITFQNVAEIHPKYYREMQEKSSEVLYIEVLKISTGKCIDECHRRQIDLEAKITNVIRSKSSLQIGNIIKIQYNWIDMSRKVGPRTPPILKQGIKTIAYLHYNAEKKVYELSARGASFDTVTQ